MTPNVFRGFLVAQLHLWFARMQIVCQETETDLKSVQPDSSGEFHASDVASFADGRRADGRDYG